MELKRRGFKFKFSKVNKLGTINLILSLGLAMVTTIWAVYLESFLKNQSLVGFLSSALTVIAILAYFFLIPLIQKYNKVRLYSISLILYILSYLLFATFPFILVIIGLSVLVAILGSLRVTCFGIILRDLSKNQEVSENEGFVYTLFNVAWFIGPLLAGFISSLYGVGIVFLFAAIFVFIALVLFEYFKIKDNRKTKREDKNILKVFVDYFKNKNRIKSYIASAGVTFWCGLLYIYMPMYIIDSGYSEVLLGYFVSATMLPLILTEYYFGKIAGKIGFRKIFFLGYIIMAICAISCFFISDIYFIMGILILASFGYSMVEPTTEAYFFDIISEKQRDKFYGPYSTAIDSGHFLSTALAAVVLLFLPFKFVFLFFGISMLIFAVFTLGIKNVLECRRD